LITATGDEMIFQQAETDAKLSIIPLSLGASFRFLSIFVVSSGGTKKTVAEIGRTAYFLNQLLPWLNEKADSTSPVQDTLQFFCRMV